MTDSALRHTTHALVEMALHYRPGNTSWLHGYESRS